MIRPPDPAYSVRHLAMNGLQLHRSLLQHEDDDEAFLVGLGTHTQRDRTKGELQRVMDESLAQWRRNPLARRIIDLTTQYVIGKGVHFTCEDADTEAFLRQFWNHPQNRMDIRIHEWSDELCRSGNLFVLLSSDAAGMSYVRAIPADHVLSIMSRPNDVEQACCFLVQEVCNMDSNLLENKRFPRIVEYPAADRNQPTLAPCMLHFVVNRPVGAQWGEPDLAPVLDWLNIYESWLEDRARLNKYRNSFLYVVNDHSDRNDVERKKHQATLNAHAPTPGSILVPGKGEEWTILSAKLESADANTDGEALKRMIAAGAGVPMHFLAEPEAQSKAGAEAAGGATYRNYEQRQQVFLTILREVLEHVIVRRGTVAKDVVVDAPLCVDGDDISAMDNLALSDAGMKATEVMLSLLDRGLVGEEEVLRVIYRFLGEEGRQVL